MATAKSLVRMIRLTLAFGEYIPFGDWFPFLYKLSPNTGSFTRGNHTKPLIHNNIKYGILICYEDILPNFVLDVMENNRIFLSALRMTRGLVIPMSPLFIWPITFRSASTGVIWFVLPTRGLVQ